MNQPLIFSPTHVVRPLLTLALACAIFFPAWSQPPQSGGIASLSPTSAETGTTDLTVTLVLDDAGARPLPPDFLDPMSVTIGEFTGTSVQRDHAVITALFDVPADAVTGVFDVEVRFSGRHQQIISFTAAGAFEVMEGDPDDDDDPVFTSGSYGVVDTDQRSCYDASHEISCPAEGQAFSGQDAQVDGASPAYVDHGDGTVTDQRTGLMWQKDSSVKMTMDEAMATVQTLDLGGYDDWRLPTIKELYSLILFSGTDPSGDMGSDTSSLIPFLDATVFTFAYGDVDAGERIIDAQYLSSTIYGSTTMGGNETVFGVNFADGRIKGYPLEDPRSGGQKAFYVKFVRSNPAYGENVFVDHGDGTITDEATGLMWMQLDSGHLSAGAWGDGSMTWEEALDWADDLVYAGYDDWRLPNAKELQSIVDYERAPDTTGSAAIDPGFQISSILNEAGQVDYPYCWTSTTHVKSNGVGDNAAYVAFGRAMGCWMGQWMDVHGAGAQRSDPKQGDPSNYPQGHGPQGDAIRIYNFARCVRDVN